MYLKLAVSGKGGVGKSTVAAALSLLLARRGGSVLAVDADPDANLAAALGIPASEQAGIIPIARRKALIEQRTGAKVQQYGQMFKLNPEVADIAASCAYRHDGVALLVLGAVEKGGGGCACPESVLLRALVQDLVLHKDETLVLDMEAGVEHLGRATARGVDLLVVVVEPGQRSVDCAKRIFRLAEQIGLSRVAVIANKVAGPADEAFLREALGEADILAMLPWSERLRAGDRDGCSVLDHLDDAQVTALQTMLEGLDANGETPTCRS